MKFRKKSRERGCQKNCGIIMTIFFFTAIRQEIRDIEQGVMDRTNNPLKVSESSASFTKLLISVFTRAGYGQSLHRLGSRSCNLVLICPQNAPHTQDVVTSDVWDRPYSREVAAFPAVSINLVFL